VSSFFPVRGFLGTGATFGEISTSSCSKRYRAHGICQTTVLLLNLLMIVLVMGPSFQRQVKPALFKVPHKWYYEAAAMHGVLGIVAELLGLYRHRGRDERSSTVAAGHTLEVVDAHGVTALGNCSARCRGDVLRMVCGALPPVSGLSDL
jgi:hypothetical protein